MSTPTTDTAARAATRQRPAEAAAATVTITETPPEPQVLRLTLRPRPTVQWDQNVVDNEGLGRKSSKRCCIFHKQRDFDESSTDSSDENNDSDSSSSNNDKAKPSRKITRPKKDGKKNANENKSVPDYQRFHA